MSNMTITITGDDGTHVVMYNDWDLCERHGALHIEDLQGWYGGVGASPTPDIQRFRRHGKFPGQSFRSHRNLELTLSWHRSISEDPDAYTAYARWASSIAWGTGPYTMRIVEDGFALSTEILIDGEPSFQPMIPGDEQAFRIRIPLRANDPFLYGDPRTAIINGYSTTPVVLNDYWTQGLTNAAGQQVLAWSSASKARPAVVNNGTADAHPVFKVVGDSAAGVRIYFQRDVVEYAAPIYEQSPLYLDFKTGSATVNGIDQSFRLSRRGWSALAPGAQSTPRVTFLSSGGSGFADCTIRDTFI